MTHDPTPSTEQSGTEQSGTEQSGTEQSGTDHYALLGVARDATPASIRKAWRRRTDKAGPGTAEFARLNEAADTLLDPVRRERYDATLPAEPSPEDAEDAGNTAPVRRGWMRVLAFWLVPVLTVVAVAAAVLLTVEHRQDVRVERARTEATAAAERALPTVLGYDYRRLDEDRAAAERLLSPAYRTEFGRTFDILQKGTDGQPSAAAQTKTVVTASVAGTAVIAAEQDRVHVLAFVDQASRHGEGDPMLFQNRVDVSMVRHGGAWLVDGLDPR